MPPPPLPPLNYDVLISDNVPLTCHRVTDDARSDREDDQRKLAHVFDYALTLAGRLARTTMDDCVDVGDALSRLVQVLVWCIDCIEVTVKHGKVWPYHYCTDKEEVCRAATAAAK